MALFAALSCSAHAQLADKKALTLDAAKKIAAAAEAEAKKNKWNVVIAIVDDGGHLIYLQRMDGTQTGSVEVAIKKAQNRDGVQAADQGIRGRRRGRTRTRSSRCTARCRSKAAFPITVGGQMIGAIGVSGVKSHQDGQIAKAAQTRRRLN